MTLLLRPSSLRALPPRPPADDTGRVRLRVEITGAVQGVGFRPHVYRLATAAGLVGWVVNDLAGVRIEVEGHCDRLERFMEALRSEAPLNAVVTELRHAWLPIEGFEDFSIRASDAAGPRTTTVLPDLATCAPCLIEVLDPRDRRAGYPFTNCTDCGPRFSIIRDLPYDRPATTMAGFRMCPTCEKEYRDPTDRRFHAQPNACPVCGPRLSWMPTSAGPHPAEDGVDPLTAAAAAVAEGRIVAVKGLGGFHLICDAANEEAVRRLRDRKGRPTKPFAVMAGDVDQVEALCRLSPVEKELLTGPQAPIVLLRAVSGHPGDPPRIAPSVAPGNPFLGVMLPYTPLHHLLLRACGGPLVATSGNRSEEPICTTREEALERLGNLADAFLLHDRPIERPVDDSVAAVIAARPVLLRRSRGWAPLPLQLARSVPSILAVGGQQKNVVGLAQDRKAWLGQHIGDLGTPESFASFERCIEDLLRLYRVEPEVIAHDLHPDYAATRWALDPSARASSIPDGVRRIGVQHHHAHLASVLAEHDRATGSDPALGIVWDGTGYGSDGTIWGGEFLLGDARAVRRVAHLHPFRLPGGEAAVRDPARVALALLAEAGLPTDCAPVPPSSRALMLDMVERGIRSPITTSAGRLFDGVAALLGLVGPTSFEGEAAMALEYAALDGTDGHLPITLRSADESGEAGVRSLVLDWRPTLAALLDGLDSGVSVATLARRFHGAMIEGMRQVAARVGAADIALSGGCFQNRILAESGAARLEADGFRVLVHRQVPPNDGGLALGQIVVAAAAISDDEAISDSTGG